MVYIASVVITGGPWPPGTTVSIYTAAARHEGQEPGGAAIASAAVGAASASTTVLTVTDAGIVAGGRYVGYAKVGTAHVYAQAGVTTDSHNAGRATGLGDTTSGGTGLANVTTVTGAWAIGQRVSGPGIPPGTFLVAGSGASWTMSDKATATATGVALEGHGAAPAVAGGQFGGAGATLVPVSATRWRARVMQRRSAAGTS